ncbi:MAG TPA: hypothetical protein VNC80_07410, partial [Mycobacteriales bacterium]|nr:hypothetical protein [Mycobacteriales bacterium]
MRDGGGLAGGIRERDRLLPRGHGSRYVHDDDPLLCEVGVRPRQLRPARERLQQLDRGGRRPLGLRSPLRHPLQPGQPAQPVAHPQALVACAPDRQRLLAGLDRPRTLVGDRALPRHPLEQVGAGRGIQAGAGSQRPLVLGGRVRVRADPGGALGRRGREPERRLGVPARLGVVGEPGR